LPPFFCHDILVCSLARALPSPFLRGLCGLCVRLSAYSA
jgi:hypothetical protein